MKNEKGITLITLMITLFVLLTIVGVTVGTQLSKNGQVREIVEITKKSFDDNVVDALLIIQTNYVSKSEYIEYLKNNNYIDKDGIINVEKLLEAKDCEYGKGNNKNDVYLLTQDLNVLYYDKEGTENLVRNIVSNMEV